MPQWIIDTLSFVKTHPMYWVAFVAVVNTVLHFTTPKDVDAFAEKNPFLAKVATLMRRMGMEPIALLAAVWAFFQSNPPPPAPPKDGAK